MKQYYSFQNSCGKSKGCDTQEYILPHGGTREEVERHINESLGEDAQTDKSAGHDIIVKYNIERY